jgi:RHS repeat-associated protein
MPNGQARSYGYDDQGRLTQLANTHPTMGNLATFDYGYDLNHATSAYDRLGQRVSLTANVPAQSLTNALTKYSYDANYQLTRADYPTAAPYYGDIESWTYDAIGNRLTSTKNGFTTSYTYQKIGTNPNNWQRLLTAGATSYTYDNNGNTTTEGSNTYGWDYENRMTSIAGAATTTYKYDYQGRRTSKTVGGVTTTYLYDGLSIVSEWSTATIHYLHGPGIDEPLARVGGGAPVVYFTADGLGSISTAADAGGVMQNSYTYDAWGVTRSSSENVPQSFRYTSREVGDLPDRMFYRARFYGASVGRFLSEDPLQHYLRLVGGAVYSYVGSDPPNYADPLGMSRCKTIVKYGHPKTYTRWRNNIWIKTRSHLYPNIMPNLKIGAGTSGFLIEECTWVKILQITKYLMYKWTLIEICQCPDTRRVLSVSCLGRNVTDQPPCYAHGKEDRHGEVEASAPSIHHRAEGRRSAAQHGREGAGLGSMRRAEDPAQSVLHLAAAGI